MGWSFEASVAFSIVEAVCICWITIRALLLCHQNNNPYVRGQLYLVPFLITLLATEVCQALLWLDENLVSVTFHDDHQRPCSKYNKHITLFYFLIIGAFQPFCLLYPCRRVGPYSNRDLMQVPEGMALFHALLIFYTRYFWVSQDLLGSDTNNNNDTINTNDTALQQQPIVISNYREEIQDHNYQTYLNSETCTYIGRNNHALFWTFHTTDSWMTPNACSFGLAMCSIVFARPYRFSSGMVIVLAFANFLVISILRSTETNYLWCLNGVLLSLYYVIQPYIFPIESEEYSYHQSPDSLVVVVRNNNNNPTRATKSTTTASVVNLEMQNFE